MAITLRQTATDTGSKATALTHQEVNDNFKDFLSFTTATTSAGPYTINSVKLPAGTTAQRPASPSAGFTRYNTTLGVFEGYNGTEWINIGQNAPVSTSIQGPSSGNEGTVVTLVIAGWVTGATYAVSVTGGTTTVVTNSIYWTLPSVSVDTIHTLTLTVNGSTQYTKTVNVLNVATVTDTSISVTNFAVNNGNTGWTI